MPAEVDKFKEGAHAMLWHVIDTIKEDIKTRDYSLVSSATKLADLADSDKADESRQAAKMNYERDKSAKSTLEFLAQRLSSGSFRENFSKAQIKIAEKLK